MEITQSVNAVFDFDLYDDDSSVSEDKLQDLADDLTEYFPGLPYCCQCSAKTGKITALFIKASLLDVSRDIFAKFELIATKYQFYFPQLIVTVTFQNPMVFSLVNREDI